MHSIEGKSDRQDDLNLLVPIFRERVARLLLAISQRGHKPLVFETLRSRERANANEAKRTGIADSMHCYGVAVDIICQEHSWSCFSHECMFFRVLGEEARKLGLTWGGDWSIRDYPHVQAIPVGLQRSLRAAKTPSTFVSNFYARREK